MRPASTPGIIALKNYCMKSDTRVAGPWADTLQYLGGDLIQELYPWQGDIKERVDGPVHPRNIDVLYNQDGNIGKSAFCKYMAFHYGAPVCGWGKAGDILNLVSKVPNRPVYLFDLSRSKPQDWARDDIAAAMEGIKNGCFMNTKYETKQVLMNTPHVWMFCNLLPNLSSMSADRWCIWRVNPISLELIRMSPGEVAAVANRQRFAVKVSLSDAEKIE